MDELQVKTWRGYIVLTSLPNPAARERVHQAALTVGKQLAPSPAYITHGRVSLDGSMMLVEGEFTEEELADMKGIIGGRSSITKAAENAMGLLQLGKPGCSYEESHKAALEYLATNRKDWETAEDAKAEAK